MCRFGSPGLCASRNDCLPGAAGVLLSRYHASPDLILVIDAREKRMFDAIDGRRSIAEIVDSARGDSTWRHAARVFFERLWWHDQAVFDRSPAQRAYG